MAQTVLVTGVNGFVGKHLASLMASQGIDVVGIGNEPALATEISKNVKTYYSCDLSDPKVVLELSLPKVDAVVHLAGLAAVGPSFDQPREYIDKNTAMLIGLAEKFIVEKSSPRFVVVSSGAIYSPNQSMPLDELSTIDFNSPYVVSKVAMENLCTYYSHRGLSMTVARPFNHLGPGQGQGFLLPDLSQQLLDYKLSAEPIVVGNLKTKRDYTDVRDVVRAYFMLATADKLGHPIYNICSGTSHSGEEIFEILRAEMKMEQVKYEEDPAKIRPTDPPNIFGSYNLIKQDAGWAPEIPIKQTVHDYVVWAAQAKGS